MERLGSYTKPQIYSYILISPYSWWVRPVFQWVFGCRKDACGKDWISIYWKIVTQNAWLNHFNYNMSWKYVLLQKMIYLAKLRLCVWALIKGSLSGSAMENQECMKTRSTSVSEFLLTTGTNEAESLPQVTQTPLKTYICLLILTLACANLYPRFLFCFLNMYVNIYIYIYISCVPKENRVVLCFFPLPENWSNL